MLRLPFHSAGQLHSLTLSSGIVLNNTVAAFTLIQHSLTSLAMFGCQTNSISEVLSNVAVLRQLRSLMITGFKSIQASTEDQQVVAEAANSIWCNLQHLTELSLEGSCFDDAALCQLTKLSKLHILEMAQNNISNPSTSIPLPKSLDYLDLANSSAELDCGKILAHGPFTALVHLDITGNRLSSPVQLSAVTNLASLWMNWVDVDKTHQLLSVLPQLSRLEELSLRWTFQYLDGVEAQAPCTCSTAAAAYCSGSGMQQA